MKDRARGKKSKNMFLNSIRGVLEVWKVRGKNIRVHWAKFQIIWSQETSGNQQKNIFLIFVVLIGLPRVPLPWGPLVSKGSPPMESFWAPKGSPPMGSLGFPRAPSHGIPWPPKGPLPRDPTPPLRPSAFVSGPRKRFFARTGRFTI